MSEAQANPNNNTLANEVNTLFKGEALRGMLLDAYAFGAMGTIMGYAAIGAFIAAAIMLPLNTRPLPRAKDRPESRGADW